MRTLVLFSLSLLIGCPGTPKDTDTGPDAPSDQDRDGTPDDEDCSPQNPAIHKDATEVCDTIDNNCDGTVDEGVTTPFYADSDNDGFGDPSSTKDACSTPTGYSDNSDDCDDSDAAYNPGATEDNCADPNDYNCDGSTGYTDADGDGTAACEDCNDNDAAINPGGTELCNGKDDNCDGTTDGPDAADAPAWYTDSDGDGFGVEANPIRSCDQPAGTASTFGDCNDSDSAYNPGASESDCTDPNDYNCDGSSGYDDADSDGYPACQDCNDGEADQNPGATEVCNGADDNCDGATDEDSAADNDADNFGDPNVAWPACNQPTGYVADNLDCDDTSADVSPDATEVCNGTDDNCDGSTDEDSAADAPTWYADADGDAYGDPNVGWTTCTQPSGYVADNLDCDDTSTDVSPAATELCNGIDDNCDGSTDEDSAADAPIWYSDTDSDGYGDAGSPWITCTQPTGYVADNLDCDDTSADVSPAEIELCNGIDDNCDGSTDEDSAADALTWYADSDGDGYGDAGSPRVACTQPAAYVADNLDCDDTSADVSPADTELCNGIDDNCDGNTDEATAADASTWYADTDTDGYGNAGSSMRACTQPAGYLADATDCNDSNATISPGDLEYCNGTDDNCDGSTDEDSATDAQTLYTDGDGDGYGNSASSRRSCSLLAGYSLTSGDCNDSSTTQRPGLTETCNGQDDNCDGATDEDSASGAPTWYADTDADTQGNPSSSRVACNQPSGYVSNNTDCNDSSNTVYSGATEYCNSIDDNCNGTVDDNNQVMDGNIYYQDSDGDGHGMASMILACSMPAGYAATPTDCNDSNSAINPGAAEICDSANTDENCNGSADDNDSSAVVNTMSFWYLDTDGDNYGANANVVLYCDPPSANYVGDGDDCNEANSAINPGAAEVCDSIDNNCNGLTDDGVGTAYYQDLDGDGTGNSSVYYVDCSANARAAAGYRLDDGDCNDSSVIVHPYAFDVAGDSVDHDCNGSDSPRVTWTAGPEGDDVAATANLATFNFPFCGISYGATGAGGPISVFTNGRLWMGTPAGGSADISDYSESLADLASDRTIAAYWDDLYVSGLYNGYIYYAEINGALSVAWVNVSEQSTAERTSTRKVSFGLTLYPDGRILYAYGPNTTAGKDALVGYACASTPSETNLSALSYPAGYWGYGSGTENAIAELYTGSSDPHDLANTAVRLCANPNGSLTHCAE